MIASGALMERKVGRVRVIGTCYADPTVFDLSFFYMGQFGACQRARA